MRERLREFSQRLVGHVWFELVVLLLIILSVGLLGEEFLTPLGTPEHRQLAIAQGSLTMVFFCELLLRWCASESNRRFVRECWPDILALLPSLRVFKLGIAFRLLRLLRLIRVMRLLGGSSQLQGGSRLARLAESAAVMVIVWVALLGGTFGLAGYESNFHYDVENLVEAFWRSIFSFFSNQYVDQYPKSVGGKVVALFVIVLGTGFFALITGLTSAIISDKMREGSKALSDYLLKQLQGHIVICGWNSGGMTALRELQIDPTYSDKDVIIICDREEIPELQQLPFPQRVRLLRDDFTRVGALQRANIETATVAMILSDTGNNRTEQDADARVVLAALTIEKLNPEVRSCAELSNKENEPHLRMGRIDEVVVSGEVSGSMLAQAAINAVGSRILRDILDPVSNCNLRSREIEEDLVGMTFCQLLSTYHEKFGLLPVAVARPDGKVLINPFQHVMGKGDRVFLLEGRSIF